MHVHELQGIKSEKNIYEVVLKTTETYNSAAPVCSQSLGIYIYSTTSKG